MPSSPTSNAAGRTGQGRVTPSIPGQATGARRCSHPARYVCATYAGALLPRAASIQAVRPSKQCIVPSSASCLSSHLSGQSRPHPDSGCLASMSDPCSPTRGITKSFDSSTLSSQAEHRPTVESRCFPIGRIDPGSVLLARRSRERLRTCRPRYGVLTAGADPPSYHLPTTRARRPPGIPGPVPGISGTTTAGLPHVARSYSDRG